MFQGTNIASGKARGVVIGTGLNTEIGKYIHNTFNLFLALSQSWPGISTDWMIMGAF